MRIYKGEERKKKKWIYVVLVILIFGSSFIAYPFIESKMIGYVSSKEYLITKENKEAEVSYNFEDITPISSRNVIAAIVNNKKLPVIGRIKIPSVGIDLPIIKGVSNTAMSSGAGTLKPNQRMGEGNFTLASHHMRNANLLFTPLDRVEVGASIFLYDGLEIFEYAIVEKKIIEATDVEVIEDQKERILVTLITCSDSGEKRLMIVGELVE